MISRDTIEEVRNRIDILDVVGDFVTLKKSGQNYKALSPFANEKTPSFFVVPAKGIFKDFSSGKGGDAFTFVMEHEKLSYAEAIRYLAKKYGVEIKEDRLSDENRAEQSEREGLYILMNFAKDYYRNLLMNTEEGRGVGLSYFRERGFHDRTLEKFELGYALEGWENFSKEAISKGYNKDLLEKAGLVVKKEEDSLPAGKASPAAVKTSSYDRFRGRVIFPVHNMSGKVIAFGARTCLSGRQVLGKDKLPASPPPEAVRRAGKHGNQPKYINSPETDIYHKSDVLYGLYQARNAIRQQDKCYLVEGYTDVISLHQADVENVVASSGTALTESQIKLIRRFTENVTVLFDGDPAGIKAALRGIDLILKGGLNVRVVLFPDNEDPDSYSRKVGTTEFQKFLKENSKDFVSFKASLFAAEAAGDPIRKAESIKEIVTSIALIPDPVKRSVYIQETSNLLKISESVLLTELNKILIQERRKQAHENWRDPKEIPVSVESEGTNKISSQIDMLAIIQNQEKETVRLLLNYADRHVDDNRLPTYFVNELEDVEFTHPHYREIYYEFKAAELREKEPVNTNFFIEYGTPEIKRVVTDLTVSRYLVSKHWGDKYNIFIPTESDKISELAYGNVLHLKLRVIQKHLDDNLKLLKEVKDIEEETRLLEFQKQLKSGEIEISNYLGIVIAR